MGTIFLIYILIPDFITDSLYLCIQDANKKKLKSFICAMPRITIAVVIGFCFLCPFVLIVWLDYNKKIFLVGFFLRFSSF
jgi:hypothetical protein